MSFAIFKGERSIKDLVGRLFGISGPQADKTASALLDANPQLKDISNVPVGSVLKVPPTAPPLSPSEQAETTLAGRAAFAAQAQQTLDAINQRLTEMEARASDSANAFLTLVQSDQAQVLVQNSPQLKQELPNLIASTQSVVTAAKTNLTARTQALSEVRASLSTLVNAGQSKT